MLYAGPFKKGRRSTSDHPDQMEYKTKREKKNIAGIANAVQCHSKLSGHYDCHD